MQLITKYNAILKIFGLTKIPLLFFVNPTITHMDNESVELKIPLKWRTSNHLGSLYFGTMAVGADCAAGLLATKFIRESKSKVHLSFKDFHANFLLRAQSDTYFVNRQGKEIKAFVDEVVAQPGVRKNFAVLIDAECFDAKGVRIKVADFKLTLSLKAHA
jgi:acyl-coenzyme A thioesterase PaaI-like protein